MAASGTLPQPNFSRKSPIGKSGVLTLSGFGIKVRMQCGHLEIEDGIGPERRRIRLARVGHGLRRLVLIGSDGFITLEAIQWVADQDASFLLLDRDGSILATTGPVRPSDAKLRRAQALAHHSGAALWITRELIGQKLAGQEEIARIKLLDTTTADTIARFRAEVPTAESITTIRLIESQAARAYWSAWSTLPVNFPKKDLHRVPEHWLRFGSRQSPLSGSPRLAASPANAILNYLYSILESETRIAAAVLGLDVGLGILHVDTTARDSLACDLMEPVRPHVDSYLLEWITRQPLRRDWFVEQRDGNCRLLGPFAAHLCQTAPTWGRAVAPYAEWVARAFWSTIHKPDAPFATRLTQSNKRQAKGAPTCPPAPRTQPPQTLCRGCGKNITAGRTHCAPCSIDGATERLGSAARIGRVAARSPEARAKHAASRRRHAEACSGWDLSKQPPWLTSEVFSQRIQPLLAGVPTSVIRSGIGVSRWYASKIRQGYRPHPRHWEELAKLVGILEGV
jgi:CRISPR-associated endonuclease Cas1